MNRAISRQAVWCWNNNLSLNVQRMKELIVYFRNVHCQQHPVLESAGYQGSILDQEHRNNGQESPLASLHPPEAKNPSPHHVLVLQKSHRERPDKLHHCVVRSLDHILPQDLLLHSEGS